MGSDYPGMGVMLGMLGGNKETVETVKAALNKRIASVALVDDAAEVRFDDGAGIRLSDEGQSCCESRYMRTDDDLSQFVGATLTDIEIREAPSVEAEYESHDVQFLVFVTDRGNVTFSNHNEHNGYYGGFWIVAKPLK